MPQCEIIELKDPYRPLAAGELYGSTLDGVKRKAAQGRSDRSLYLCIYIRDQLLCYKKPNADGWTWAE